MYDDGIGNLLDEVESKKKRLARKAELARMSRKRKKTRMGDLEAEVQRLQQEIQTLKKQKNANNNNNGYTHMMNMRNSNSNTAVNSNDEVTENTISAAIDNVINTYYNGDMVNTTGTSGDDSNEESVSKCIDDFVLQHTSYIQNGDRYLHEIQQHIQPIIPLDFLTWICCTHDENQYQYNMMKNGTNGNANNNTIWYSLFVEELGLDDEQMKDLLSVKTTIKKQSKLSVEIQKAYQKLSQHLSKQFKQRIENMEKIRSILSPKQFACYLDWVQKYGNVCLMSHSNNNANSSNANGNDNAAGDNMNTNMGERRMSVSMN